jgi:ABC-type nitrate/sulfonate/bicarbonate transport system substrate-binding protein
MLKRCFLAVVLAFAVTSPQMVRPQELPTIHIASVTNDTCSAILYAMKLGLFQKAGLNIDFQGMSSGAAASAAVAGGAAQFGQSSLVTLIDAHARGIPFTLIAPSGIITRGSMYAAALVRSDSPIKTGADLNGKTFAVPAIKDLNQIAAMAWVDQNGGDSRTLKFIELSAPATIAAIEDGRVDAGNVGTPTLTLALEGGKTRIMAQVFDAFGNRFANTGWFTTTDYAKNNPDTVTRFITVMRQAAQLANTHHAETAALLAEYFKGDPKVYARMARVEFSDTLDPHDVQPLIDAAAKYKAIDRAFPAQEMISPLALGPKH